MPATTEMMAIKSAGKDKESFTKEGPLGRFEKVFVISGREAEMVIIDMMVRLLTNNKVAFTCQLSVFIGVGFYNLMPPLMLTNGGI